MDALLQEPPRARFVNVLFDEDFDVPEAAPEPEVIEAVFSASEMAGAREAAWLAGHAAGVQEVGASGEAATRQALETIASQIKVEREATATQAEQSAEAIAGLRYGDAEVRAIVRAVLPALIQEPLITVRANPRTAAAVAQEIELFDPELAAHVQTTASNAMPPGDVRITWRNGAAARDATALWRQVAAVLVPAGLLPAVLVPAGQLPAALVPAAQLQTQIAIKETVDG